MVAGLRADPVVAFLALSLLLALGRNADASGTTDVVQVQHNATYGDILTTISGLALYTLNTDHNGQSTCTGSCLKAWPPLTVAAGTTPAGGAGVTGTVAAVTQANGTIQVTYNGSPLYTFAGDSPGQVTGQGVAGFFLVMVVAASPPTTTSTSPPVPQATSTTAPPAANTQTSASPAAAATGSGPSAPVMPSEAHGTLAFTGSGTGLIMLVLVGAALVGIGALAKLVGPWRDRQTIVAGPDRR
jgi:predicted lipoprotein with Yx(FWY)xxD motif